jgi:hypothetical protein
MSGLIFGQNHHIFVQTLGNPPIHASSGSPHGTTGGTNFQKPLITPFSCFGICGILKAK